MGRFLNTELPQSFTFSHTGLLEEFTGRFLATESLDVARETSLIIAYKTYDMIRETPYYFSNMDLESLLDPSITPGCIKEFADDTYTEDVLFLIDIQNFTRMKIKARDLFNDWLNYIEAGPEQIKELADYVNTMALHIGFLV